MRKRKVLIPFVLALAFSFCAFGLARASIKTDMVKAEVAEEASSLVENQESENDESTLSARIDSVTASVASADNAGPFVLAGLGAASMTGLAVLLLSKKRRRS